MTGMKYMFVIGVLALGTSTARADDRGGSELNQKLVAIAPGPGLDRAPVRPPPWCGGGYETDETWAFNVANELDTFRESVGHENQLNRSGSESRLFHAAALVCNAPRNPVAQRAAAEIEQLWINRSGLSDADAVASLTARVVPDAFKAEHEKLCSAVPQPPDFNRDRDGNSLANAYVNLFGCPDREPLWLLKATDFDYLGELVDRGAAERDPLVHLAWVLLRQYLLLDPDEKPENRLIGYVVDQFDLRAVSPDAVMHALDAGPYRGSRYARIIVLESLGRLRLRNVQIEADVAKLTGDPDWKELLITAPQRGAAAWQAAADQAKDALARSDQFARDADEGKDVHGCARPLRSDVLAILKKLKHDNFDAIGAAISDHPVAGLLIKRLARCLELERARGGEVVGMLADSVRVWTGPRMAAYFAMIEALGAMPERRRPSLSIRHLRLDGRRDDHERLHHAHPFSPLDEAVIARVDKARDGAKVTFVTNRSRVMDQECHETTKVDSITSEGKLIYRRACHDTHLIWVDRTHPPRSVPLMFADGLRGGQLAVINEVSRDDMAVPIVAWANKSQKRVVVYYGLPLE